MHVAYICSRYPDVSHTFIQREIRALRDEGVAIDTFSVREPGAERMLSRLDREEHASTYALLPPRPLHLFAAHARAVGRHGRAWASTLRRALALAPPGPRGALWQVFYLAEATLLWDRCRRRGIRHVHAHFANVGADVALLAAHLGRATGEKWSWSFTMHGSTELYDVREHRLAEKAGDAEFVACISDYTRSQLMMLVPESRWSQLAVVRCGVDTEAFAPPERPERDALRVLTVSRLVFGKGLTLLLEALAELVSGGTDIELVVVGDGPERAAIEARVHELGLSERVELAGSMGQDEIRARYADADAFCLPSFAEGVPVVLMEAMAMELAVVATRITGIPELIEDEASGLLVRPARPDELALALGRLAGDSALRERLGRAGRDAVLAHYEIGATARSMRALFEAQVSGHSRPRHAARRASAAGSPR